jgi:hypothetical protein
MGFKIRNVDFDVQMALQASTAGRDDHDFEKETKNELSVLQSAVEWRLQKWTRTFPVDDTADD